MSKNKPLVSGGKSLNINTKTSSEKCSDKFKDSINNISIKARNFCDNAEWFYFLKAKKKFMDSEELWWQALTLQEKKVINGLEDFKIPAYLGYRNSFKDGINRKDYKKKPIFTLLEVASACNIKCPFCFQSDPSFTTKEYMGIIDTKLALRAVDEIDDMKIRGITIASRGEPLLYNDLELLLNYIKTKDNILEIKVNTNAKRLTEKRLIKLINTPINILVISTDHYEKDKYEKFRHGSNYETFIKNITKINEVRSSFNRESNLYTRASGVKVDPKMDVEKFDDFYKQYFDESGSVDAIERWNTYTNEKEQGELNPCGFPFEKMYIWYDGVINPCDNDYKSQLSPGKFGELTLKQCWDNMQILREEMLNNRRHLHEPCDRCYVS
ncbi:radical SAM/SPASM domain-containing protein [Prochlorococcus marinus]|nr:radical SAM/SPASM domain-containing protein [Prochlorococcus marinus]